MRSAATQRFDLNTKNRKGPFEWDQVVDLAVVYGVRHQGYYHVVVATMSVVMFGGMCRYGDAWKLLWSNIRFESGGSGFEITFDKRKNAQFSQGNKVSVASSPFAAVCPVRLLRELQLSTVGAMDLHVFRGFNGKLVATSPSTTAPGPKKITYDQFFRFPSLWFSGVMCVSVAAFRKQFATQFGRSGCAFAASNAGVPAELWGQHGDLSTWEAQKRYMKSDTARLLSVSRAAMGPPKTPASDVRIECESAGAPPEMAEEEQAPDVVGMPSGAFVWS